MPITADRISRLREFGLSEYAARSYLALLDLGTTEARDVSALSKVPASKIYHILDQLHEKGLVVILPEFPRKYAPVPFAEFLQRIHDEHEAAAQTIRSDRETLTQMFAVLGDVAGGDRGSVTLMRGRRNAVERFHEGLASAKRDVLFLASVGQSADTRMWHEPIEGVAARGVSVRVLGPSSTGETRARPAGLPDGASVLIVDGHKALLVHALPDDGHPSEGNDTALYVDQEGIVLLLAALLESQWAGSPPLGRALEVVSERPSAPDRPRPPTGPVGA